MPRQSLRIPASLLPNLWSLPEAGEKRRTGRDWGGLYTVNMFVGHGGTVEITRRPRRHAGDRRIPRQCQVCRASRDGYRARQPGRAGRQHGRVVRQRDWSATSLGPLDGWPAHLRTSVDIVLNSPMAMVLMWGPQHVMIYNDDYIQIAGERHPAALGGTVPAVWPEIWDWNARILEAGLRGETQVHRECCLPLLRDGQRADVCFDLYYTPVHGADGQVDGVLCTALELTARMEEGRQLKLATAELGELNTILQAESEAVRAANRRLGEERALLRALFQQAPSFMAMLRGPRHVFELANEHYLRLVGHRDLLGKTVEAALPEVKEQDSSNCRQVTAGEPYEEAR